MFTVIRLSTRTACLLPIICLKAGDQKLNLVAIGIEKVEDVGEVVFCLPLREQEEQDHHVRHG
jgi:hypothetical protein